MTEEKNDETGARTLELANNEVAIVFTTDGLSLNMPEGWEDAHPDDLPVHVSVAMAIAARTLTDRAWVERAIEWVNEMYGPLYSDGDSTGG